MKNLMVVVLMGMFFAVLAAGLTLAAEQPCQTGQSCSENFTMPVAQTGPMKNAPKKSASAEEAAAYQKAVAIARERDYDRTVVFTKTSDIGICYYWELENKIDEWLIRATDVVVDKKEYLSPAFSIEKINQNTGKVYNRCTSTIIVHYHKATPVDK